VAVPTTTRPPHADVPVTPILIKSARLADAPATAAPAGKAPAPRAKASPKASPHP